MCVSRVPRDCCVPVPRTAAHGGSADRRRAPGAAGADGSDGATVGWDGRAAFAELRLSIAVSFCSSLLSLLRQFDSSPIGPLGRVRSEPRRLRPRSTVQPRARQCP
eukprot:766886-Hanusia_phi.AAC.2